MAADQLIIFAKNPVLGETKTRLAKTIGHQNALKVYLHLLEHTAKVCLDVNVDRHIYYSSFIENDDIFDDRSFVKNVQIGDDLGERMYNAFKDLFGQWAEKVVIVGTDCKELQPDIIVEAYKKLNECDVVIGPANDGGYYLLGMNTLYKELFFNKVWSSENVLLDTILDLKKLNVKYELLPVLNDIDYKEDLGDLERLLE